MNYSYNLLDWRDYLRLLYAVFFDWHAFPEFHQSNSRLILVLQALVPIGAINLIVGLAVQLSGGQFDWQQMVGGVVVGMVGGMVGGMALGGFSWQDREVVSVFGGAIFGIFGGVILGMALDVVSAVMFGVALGVAFGQASDEARGVVFSVALGIVLGVSLGIKNLLGGWPGSLAGVVITSGGFFVALLIQEAVNVAVERIGQRRSAWSDWCSDMLLLLVSSVGAGYLLGLFDRWLALGAPAPLITATIIVLVYTRLPLWPLEAIWGLAVGRWRARNANVDRLVETLRLAYFDRQAILPLPGEAWLLRQIASLDYNRAIRAALDLAYPSGHLLVCVSALRGFTQSNPFAVQSQINRISFFRYGTQERLLRYVAYKLPTATALAWSAHQQIETLRRRLFKINRSRIAAAKVDESLDENLLTEVIAELREAVRDLELAYQLDSTLRHVEAFGTFYRAVADALAAEGISAIAAYQSPSLPTNTLILELGNRLSAMARLDPVAAKAREYAAATAPLSGRDALLQAIEQLESVSQQGNDPFLELVVNHWRRVLAAAGGELARARLSGPVENPYVIGNPARGPLFVGREDILRRLQELWGQGVGGEPSVVLYGHRRMGKTSILQSLTEGTPFGARTIIVDFNMQRLGAVRNTAELLLALARRLHAAAKTGGLAGLAEPARAAFLEDNPYTAFGNFLDQLAALRNDHRFIVTVDEFEIIERRIEAGQLDKDLLDYWRGTFQTYPWFIMAFAGLHTLQEMRADYWNPLFASVTAVPVSFLSPGSVRRLITAPAPDFAIDYDEDAIDCIYKLTNGQPYLVQLIGHALITRFNQQGFEAGVETERRFRLADVEAVISAPEFYQDGNAYFSGVWAQAAESAPPGQVDVLKALSRAPLPAGEITRATGLGLEAVALALEALCRHDVLAWRNDAYGYTVELMRRWVERTHAPLNDKMTR